MRNTVDTGKLCCLGGIAAAVGGLLLFCFKSSPVMAAVVMISVTALGGFFLTKTKGYGQFTVSTLILLLAVSLTGILAAAGKISDDDTTSILLAVIGFAGGLFAGNRTKSSDDS